MKKNDKYGREVFVNDWITYSSGNRMGSGVVVGFTAKGHPRVLVYDEYRRAQNDMPFSTKPKAVGLHSGFIKMEAPTTDMPN